MFLKATINYHYHSSHQVIGELLINIGSGLRPLFGPIHKHLDLLQLKLMPNSRPSVEHESSMDCNSITEAEISNKSSQSTRLSSGRITGPPSTRSRVRTPLEVFRELNFSLHKVFRPK